MLQHDDTGRPCDTPPSGSMAQLCRHVVVGVAGANPPLAPVLLALDLTEAAGGSLDVLMIEDGSPSVVLPFGRSLAVASWVRGEKELRRRRIHDLLRQVVQAASAREVVVTASRAQGSMVQCLEDAAYPASLLVLHRLGQAPGKDDPLLAATGRLVRRTHLPVLAAPDVYRALARVVVALGEGAAIVNSQLLATGAALSAGLSLPLTVYSVGDALTRARVERAVRQELGPGGVRATFRGRHGRPAELIADQAVPNTLLVMGINDGGKRHLALGSVTEKVLQRARGPLLVVPGHSVGAPTKETR